MPNDVPASLPHLGPQIAQRESDRQTMLSALDRVKAQAAGMARRTAEENMPSSTEKQRRFMGAELARKRAGQKTKTGMSESQLSDFAGSVKKMHGGGVVPSDGTYQLQKGETVMPAPPMKTMSHGPEKHTGAAENMGDYGPDESSVARANAPFRDLHKSGHDLNHTYKTPAAAISPDVKAAGTNHSYLHPHSHAGMREVARTAWNTANKIKGMNEMGTGKT